MFISDEEANRRINSSHNVLTVIDKDGANTVGETHTEEPAVVFPDEVLPAEDLSCASASNILDVPSGALLKKMLGQPGSGRKKGQATMPKEMQAATAVAAQLTTLQNAADVFGTSVHHAHELKHGFTNQEAQYGGKDPDKELERHINVQKNAVRDLAFEKLTKALGLITDVKLEAIVDATKLGRLAKDLSGVVDKVLPKEAIQMGGVHFHVWRPEMRTEDSYKEVSVGGPR